MDFHSLSRRELQGLCKKNKIPANITNVAMADALKALEIVEGIEELMQPSQSETAQSSMETPARSEVTSPYVPPSGVRSTRRRQFGKEDSEMVKSVTRTQHTTRRNLVNDVPKSKDCEVGAPELTTILQSSKKEEDKKKHVVMTPVPLGVTSRRRNVKEDSTVQRVYSTRRSVRLAVKNVKMLNEGNNEMSFEVSMKEPTKIGFCNVEMNLKEDFGDFDETSGIAGVDSNANALGLENPEYNWEIVSAQKQGVPIGEEINLGCSAEEEEKGCHFEANDPQKKMDCSDVANGEDSILERVTELDKETWGKTEYLYRPDVSAPLNLNNEVEESDKGEAANEHHFEANDLEQEMKEKSYKETRIVFDTEAKLVEKMSDETEAMSLNWNDETGIVLDLGAEPDEEKSDRREDPSGESIVGIDTEAEMGMNFKYGAQQPIGEDMDGLKGTCNKESEGNAAVYFKKDVLEDEDSFADVEFSCNGETNNGIEKDMALIKLTELRVEEATKEVSPGAGDSDFTDHHLDVPAEELKGEESCKIETFEHEESTKAAANLAAEKGEQVNDAGGDVTTSAAQVVSSLEAPPPGFAESDSHFMADKLTCPVSCENSAINTSKIVNYQMVVFSDNKENISSAVKDTAKYAATTKKKNVNLEEMSVRKLAKMLKEKLEITNKPSED